MPRSPLGATRLLNPNSSSSIQAGARAKRWAEFARRFPDLADMTVLDLGGTPRHWAAAPVKPARVVSVNLGSHYSSDDPQFEVVQGDASDLPAEVRAQSFDLVFSNSLIEHVGGHAMRQRVADTVHAMAPRHWVQTPYRYFPVEPHWLFPGLQFLPHAARVEVSLRWNQGQIRTFSREEALDKVNEVELVGISQMRSLFPHSEIVFERFAGLVKSLSAVRT